MIFSMLMNFFLNVLCLPLMIYEDESPEMDLFVFFNGLNADEHYGSV